MNNNDIISHKYWDINVVVVKMDEDCLNNCVDCSDECKGDVIEIRKLTQLRNKILEKIDPEKLN